MLLEKSTIHIIAILPTITENATQGCMVFSMKEANPIQSLLLCLRWLLRGDWTWVIHP